MPDENVIMLVSFHTEERTENTPEFEEVESATVLLNDVSVSPPAVFAATFICGLVFPAATLNGPDTKSSSDADAPEVIVSICVPEVKPARDTVIVEVPIFVSL